MKSNSKRNKTKRTGKKKPLFEESKSDPPIDVDGNKLYDDDVSGDGIYFTD